MPANIASATISRLVKQGRVRRLDGGGYVAAERPPDPAGSQAAPPAAETTPGRPGHERRRDDHADRKPGAEEAGDEPAATPLTFGPTPRVRTLAPVSEP